MFLIDSYMKTKKLSGFFPTRTRLNGFSVRRIHHVCQESLCQVFVSYDSQREPWPENHLPAGLVRKIGIEPICNQLLFQLLIRQGRYNRIM